MLKDRKFNYNEHQIKSKSKQFEDCTEAQMPMNLSF